MRQRERRRAALAATVAAALALAACGGDDDSATVGAGSAPLTEAGAASTDGDGTASDSTADDGNAPHGTAPSGTPAPEGSSSDRGPSGGTLVLGAEQFPECINPITQCQNSSWAHWAVIMHVLPKLMTLSPDGDYVPSPLLAGEPVLAGEGVDDSGEPFSVTYTIRPEAVWDDGTPITCADVEFSWHAYLDTTGTSSTTGVEKIESVAPGDGAGECVITFVEPVAAWTDVLGGGSNYVLKADYFESTDTSTELADEIPFSGAPFKLESFDATAGEAVFVRNEAYWDPETTALLDGFTMLSLADQETELNALLAGEVAAIFPQPTPGITEQLESDPDIDYAFGAGTQFEGLWFTHASLLDPETELADPAVREALMYAIDRDLVLSEVMTPSFPEVTVLNCGGWVPTVGEWCDESDFADVTYDPDKAAELLEGAGYVRGDDGFYAKDGERLSISWQTVAGNARREAIQALLVPALADIGIELVPDNVDADTMFQIRVPQLDTEIALYAQVATPDPSVTSIFSCDQIPSEDNDFSGQNNTAWCNEEATELMKQSDRTPDPEARRDLLHQVGDLIREEAVWLPLYQLPLVTAWDATQVGGPVGLYASSPSSGFTNVYDWHVQP